MAASIEDSIVAALDHLNVSREAKNYLKEETRDGCERAFRRRKNSANQFGHSDLRSIL